MQIFRKKDKADNLEIGFNLYLKGLNAKRDLIKNHESLTITEKPKKDLIEIAKNLLNED